MRGGALLLTSIGRGDVSISAGACWLGCGGIQSLQGALPEQLRLISLLLLLGIPVIRLSMTGIWHRPGLRLLCKLWRAL